MSLDATRWAWMQQCQKATDKLVLLSMADRADENHVCFPSVARLSADTQLNRKTVMGAIRRLQEVGLIDTMKSTGASNIYRLVGVPDRAGTYPKNGTSTETGTSTKIGTTPVPKTGRHQSQKRDPNLSITNQQPTKREPRKALTFSAWMKSIPEDQDAIPQDHHVFRYAQNVGIPNNFLQLAWLWFERHYSRDEKAQLKRYADWPGVFRNAVEGNWGKLWWITPEGDYQLTTPGVQLQRELKTEAA